MIASLALAYAILSLVFQIQLTSLPWGDSSPTEIFTDLLAFSVLGFAIATAWRHRGQPALHRGWVSASIGMALISIGESTDWLHDSISDWYDPLPYEIGLWLLAALLIHRCTRNYAAQRHVRYWLLVGVAVQLLANVMEVAEDTPYILSLGSLGTVHVAVEYTELLSLLCYSSALVFTQLGPRLATAMAGYLMPNAAAGATGVAAARAIDGPVEIGYLARHAFHGLHLFRKPRYPTSYPILHRPVLREAVWLAMIATFGGSIAGRARAAGGAPVHRQLAQLCRLLRSGVDAFSYYLFELYRPEKKAEADYCLTRYETKNGLLTLLNTMRPCAPGAAREMTDKLVFADSCAALGVSTPPILLAVRGGRIEGRCTIDELDTDLFVKLRKGRGTKATERLHRIAPFRYVDRAGIELDLEGVVERLRQLSLQGDDEARAALIVQPHLRNHASLKDLADQSLIATRIVTCLNEQGEPEVTHGMLRVLAKIEPNWNSQPDTEFGAAIDIESGLLGPMTGDWPSTCTDWYTRHPITGAPVMGRRLEQWSELCDLALRAHRGFDCRVVVGWDMALTDRGPVILEGNTNMDVSFIQRGYRQGIGRSRLGELLAYHLDALLRARAAGL